MRIVMRRIAQILLLLLASYQLTVSAEPIPTIDGESFTKKLVGKPTGGHKLVQFVRESESFESWTKKIYFRYQELPGIDNDPFKYASAMWRMVEREDPQAKPQILRNERSNQVILEYATFPPEKKYVEHNVLRFWKSADGNALLSLQITRRFDLPSPELMQEFASQGMKTGDRKFSWVMQATELFDVKAIERELSFQ